MKFIRLLVTENCTQSCNYCYQPENRNVLANLDINQVKKYLRMQENRSEVLFFGGEPFLNIDLVKETIEWSKEYKQFKFEIDTNGSIIDRSFIRDYLKNITAFISLDGPEHVHDLNRGKGSWKKAVEFYRVYNEEVGKYPWISTAINKNTIKYMFETMKFIKEFQKNEKRLSGKIIYPINTINAYEYSDQDLIEYEKQLDSIIEWYLKEKIYETSWNLMPFHMAENELIYKNELNKNFDELKRYSCDCDFSRMITTEGIVQCHRQYFNKNIKNKFIREQEDFDGIDTNTFYIDDIEPCNTCERWGCLFCHIAWLDANPNDKLYKPNKRWCEVRKLTIKKSYEYIEKLKKVL